MARQNRSESEVEESEYEDDIPTKGQSGGGGSAGVRWLGVMLLFVAFVLMAFAASTPVTKNFYLFSVKITVNALIDKVTNEYRFGVWGYCTTGVKNSFGIGKAKINSTVSKGGCKDRQLGWTFRDIPGMSDNLQDAITAGLTTAFVLHIVAAASMFPALIIAIVGAAKRDKVSSSDYSEKGARDIAARRRSLRRRVFVFILIAMILTMTVFILDVAGVVLTKDKVHKKSKGMAKLDFGPAFWFVVAAFGLVLLSFFLALFDLASSGRDPSRDLSADVVEDTRKTRPSEDISAASVYSREDDERFSDVNIRSPSDERKEGRLR